MLFVACYFSSWAFVMFLAWLRQQKTKKANHVDALWALGTGLTAIFVVLMSDEGNESRGFLLIGLACLWAFRLSWFLFKNRVFGSDSEDSRYADFRSKWGAEASRNFFILFQAQVLFMMLFSLPFFAAATNPESFPQWSDFVACAVWLLAVGGESLADHQLNRFIKNPANKGQLFKGGLWRYSRHPNYFFEWLHWFAYCFLAWGSDYFLLSFVGPIAMFIFLYKVTGIPIIEKRSLEKRGEQYRQYQKETSGFIPWFPKKG